MTSYQARKRKFNNKILYECTECTMEYYENRPEKCLCGNEEFTYWQSLKEFARWRELQLLERGNHVSQLDRQVKLPVHINGIKIFTYVADFVYNDKDGVKVIEDSKGVETDVFKLKRKAIEAEYGIRLLVS